MDKHKGRVCVRHITVAVKSEITYSSTTTVLEVNCQKKKAVPWTDHLYIVKSATLVFVSVNPCAIDAWAVTLSPAVHAVV